LSFARGALSKRKKKKEEGKRFIKKRGETGTTFRQGDHPCKAASFKADLGPYTFNQPILRTDKKGKKKNHKQGRGAGSERGWGHGKLF